MKYMILDLETQIHKKYKRKANPFLEKNYIVARGWKVEGDSRCTAAFYSSGLEVDPLHIPDDVDVIVAHNAKFELLYELRFSSASLRAFFKRGGRIWCTQYAEYLLQGQDRKFHMISLDDLAPMYGGKVKVDGVKILWEQGIQTSEISRDLLTDYLIGTEEEKRNGGDIGNTELIYLGQLKKAEELGMMEAIKCRMDGLCATSDMEFNGLKVDLNRAREDLRERLAEKRAADKRLQRYLTDLPEGLVFNWGSPTHKSAIIFGGTVKYKKQTTYIDPETGELARKKEDAVWPVFDGVPVEPDPMYCAQDELTGLWYLDKFDPATGTNQCQDIFKGGKRKGEGKTKKVKVPGELKVKYQEFLHSFPGFTEPLDEWKGSLEDGAGDPVYSTASEVVEAITATAEVPFLKDLGEVNRLTKEIGTYYFVQDEKGEKKGMLTCVMKNGFLHPKLNHTSTITTRLSSSDPNLQNVTRADFNKSTGKYKSTVKAMFVSRFGDDGYMAELDYSQLEVVVQGLVSRDLNLIKDLNNRVDFHCKRVSLKNSVSYEFALDACKNEKHPEHDKWAVERTGCKIFSFQRAYGAGPALISKQTGMPVETIEQLIENEEKEYPGVVEYNKNVERSVLETATPKHTAYGVMRQGVYQEFTGCLYSFESKPAPEWQQRRGVMDTFKPTELKNYSIQGTGGEIVQLVLGKLWRWFVKYDNFGGKAFLVNTVHDCVWADIHKSVVDKVVRGMKAIMEAVPRYLKQHFNHNCPVPFPVDAEIGPNMLELKHWKDPKLA